MATDPEVIAAIEASVAARPDGVALRLHLADLLLKSGRATDALRHGADVLERQPGHQQALDVVRRATLALAGPAEAAVPPEGRIRAAADGPDPSTDEFDAFLHEVLDGSPAEVERSTVTFADVAGSTRSSAA